MLAEIMMEDPTDAERSYEAGIFSRLEGVKAAYDPNNLFRDLRYVHPNVRAPSDPSNERTCSALTTLPGGASAPAPATAISGDEAPQPRSG